MHRGEFALDTVDPFNGKLSQRITQKPGDPCTLGVSQDGKYVKRGRAAAMLAATCERRTSQRPVRVAIWGEGKTYATAEFQPTGSGSVSRPR